MPIKYQAEHAWYKTCMLHVCYMHATCMLHACLIQHACNSLLVACMFHAVLAFPLVQLIKTTVWWCHD